MLSNLYLNLAKDYQIPVVPCASALINCLKSYPDENYHNPDNTHMGILAGYLYSCLWYYMFSGEDITELSSNSVLGGYSKAPQDKAVWLRQIAQNTIDELKSNYTLTVHQ